MFDRSTAPSAPDGTRLPDQVTMGLLPYLTTHALDEDYALAAARQQGAASTWVRRPIGLAGALALAVFAVLAATAAAQTSQNSASEERERRALISQVKARRAAVDADQVKAARLQAEIDRLESAQLHTSSSASGVVSQLRLLALRSGTSAVHGPGVEIMVDDAVDAESDRQKVLDTDLQKLVNGLWAAGAEAISINGHRLTARSAIRHAGTAITVNFTSLRPPYRVLAIGDPKTLPSRFADTTSGRAWLDLPREVGLRFSMTTQNSLRLPAAEVPDLRYAKTTSSSQGKGSS